MMTQTYDQPPTPLHRSSLNMANEPQPIGDAVTTAVDKSDVQDLDPKLVAQITENVIKQLRQVNLQATSSSPQDTTTAPVAPAQLGATSSSQTTASIPPATSSESKIPSGLSDEAFRSTQSEDPPAEKHTEYGSMESPELQSARSTSNGGRNASRPRGPEKLSTSLEETPLERIWGVLFDEQGAPTQRLTRLLRGLALHLVEDYEPKNTLVITPVKMAKYYRVSKMEKEYYPWHIIFDDEDTYMSRMFRELGCEHHLVQESAFERPETPGLTPVGFAKWMTLMILAHPEEEFERLKQSVVNMPISNPDDRRERYPKDISKRLFPSVSDAKSRNDLRRAIRKHSKNAKIDDPDDGGLDSDFAGSSSSVPPRRTNNRASLSDNGDNLPSLPIERERQPYRASTGQAPSFIAPCDRIPTVGPAGESAIADDDHTVPVGPIERERMPYYAMPGRGRKYEESSEGRTVYPSSSGPSTSSATYPPAGGTSSSATSYPVPPPPRQNSTGPPTGQPGLARSSSNRSTGGRPTVGGVSASGGLERGPPPAPSAGTASAGGPSIEIHQQPPPKIRNGSFTRRRAPSTGRAYVGADSDTRASHVTFQPGTYDAPKSVYVERAGGQDGYGTCEGEHRRPRGASAGPGMSGSGLTGGPVGPEVVTSSSGRDGFDRRRVSPPKRDTAGRNGFSGEETSYRETGRY